MTHEVPTFAVVGAVNHGKSSVVSALVEDDTIRVSTMPGETVVNQRFALADLLVLIDTPGFQNARATLALLDAMSGADAGNDPLEPFRRFVAAHRDDGAFEAECRLFDPIIEGAGILYVVDASQPMRDINRCEMEILRRTGAPRLAIINRSGTDDRIDAWSGRLKQHFNLVRSFDSHRATFGDRRSLIDALASIEPQWQERLRKAFAALDAGRRQRIDDASTWIAQFLVDCLGHVERDRVAQDATEDERRLRAQRLAQRYREAITARERELHQRLIAAYAHHRIAPDQLPPDAFVDDVFAEETWRLFGLGAVQLVGVSTVAGGIAGAGIDAVTLGHSLGLGAVVGAATGAGGAFLLGRKRPDIGIDWPGTELAGRARSMLPRQALRFGGNELVAGPLKAENFPWVLLDRALCLFAFVHSLSHARRDVNVPDAERLQSRLRALRLTVDQWPKSRRNDCHRVFAAVRRKRSIDPQSTAILRAAIATSLERIAVSEREIEAVSPAGRLADEG